MYFKPVLILIIIVLLNACTNLGEYGEAVKNTAGQTCPNGVGGCTADEDRSGDFVNY
jgi:hypothetical protein